MRRADRLFQIVQVLRHKRVATAAEIAARLDVSERTIYRDMRDLSRSGVPILSEAGVGYRLLQGFDLPPLMFTEEEIEALVLGARMVQKFADPLLVRAADSVIEKVEAVIPDRIAYRLRQTQLFALNFKPDAATADRLAMLRVAVRQRRKVSFSYTDNDGKTSNRKVRPLALSFLAPIWLLTAWCELREGFRNFRADRIGRIEACDEVFEDEAGKTMRDFLQLMDQEQRAHEST
jgi:predicted DNA-binding transcriptional regulator YafY